MGLRLRSRLGNFGKISRDFGKYSSRPGFSVYNLGKITEIWSRLIFFVYCSLNLNMVIVLLPRKQREKRTRSRISRSRRDLQWTEMDMSVPSLGHGHCRYAPAEVATQQLQPCTTLRGHVQYSRVVRVAGVGLSICWACPLPGSAVWIPRSLQQ